MKIRFAAWTALVSLALVLPALAQGTQDFKTVTGTLVSTGNVSIAVKTDEGESMAFIVGTLTSMPRQELTAGDRVSVRYQRLDENRFKAIAVTLLLPARTPSAAGSGPAGP